MVIHACPPFSFSRVLLWRLIYNNIFYGLCQATVSIELSRVAEFLSFLTFPIEIQDQAWYNELKSRNKEGLLCTAKYRNLFYTATL